MHLISQESASEETEKKKVGGRHVRDYAGSGRARLEMVKMDTLYSCMKLSEM